MEKPPLPPSVRNLLLALQEPPKTALLQASAPAPAPTGESGGAAQDKGEDPPSASGRGTPALKPHLSSPQRTRTSHSSYDLPPPDPGDPLLGFAPAPHSHARRNSITADRQRAFIAELAACGIVAQAARHIGCSLEALYRLRHKHGAEEFAAAWDLAVDRGVMRLEDGALARAIEGEERMVVSAGQLVGTERRHNEALVMFFLRSRRAGRYAREAQFGPDHPLYKKVHARYAQEQRRIHDDPRRIASIQKSIEIKVQEWRMALERKWEAEHRAWIEEHGGVPPEIEKFDRWAPVEAAEFAQMVMGSDQDGSDEEDGEAFSGEGTGTPL